MAKIYDNQKGPKDEWAKLKNEPLKVKLEWLLQYYGLTALFVTVGLAVLVSIAVTVILNSRPCVISGDFYCSIPDVSYNERLKEDLCGELGLEPKKTRIDVSNTAGLYSGGDSAMIIQRLSTRIATLDLDFAVGNSKLFNDFTDPTDENNSAFADLSKFLPEKTYRALLDAGRVRFIETDFGAVPYYIDVIGTRFATVYGIDSGDVALGVVFNTQNKDAVILLIEKYLLE